MTITKVGATLISTLLCCFAVFSVADAEIATPLSFGKYSPVDNRGLEIVTPADGTIPLVITGSEQEPIISIKGAPCAVMVNDRCVIWANYINIR